MKGENHGIRVRKRFSGFVEIRENSEGDSPRSWDFRNSGEPIDSGSHSGGEFNPHDNAPERPADEIKDKLE